MEPYLDPPSPTHLAPTGRLATIDHDEVSVPASPILQGVRGIEVDNRETTGKPQ